MPCKMFRSAGFICLIFVLLLPVEAFAVMADQQRQADRALFWSIQKNGQPAGFVLGTIHSEDPRVLDFSEDFFVKLKANNIFAMELLPDLPTLSRLSEYMRYPPGQTLESVIGTDRFTAVKAALSTYEVPLEFVTRMKPWAAMMTLSTPESKTGYFMDLSLSLRASGSGLKVIGLETLEQQLSFLQEMPEAMQLTLLDQALAEFGNVGAVHDQMVGAYLKNDLHELQRLSEQQLGVVGDEASAYFIEAGIHARNHRMAATLLPYLSDNKVFVAIGALHLPGEEGLLNLLRNAGFELSPLSLPLSGLPVATE